MTASYTIQITEQGEYILWGRVKAPSGGDDSFFVQIDDQANHAWDVKRGSGWNWDRVKNRQGDDPVVFQLTAGTHTVKIKRREDGTGIDKLFLTNDSSAVPSGEGEAAENLGEEPEIEEQVIEDHWLEAEFADTIETPLAVMQAADSSAGGYIVAPNGSGPDYSGETAVTASYTIQIAEAGEYILWGRVKALTGGDDSFFVQIDDTANHVWDVKRGSFWDWDRVKNRQGADPVIFYLTAGTHTIKVKRREDGAELDKLYLTNNRTSIPEGEGEAAENLGEEPEIEEQVFEDHWLEAEFADTIEAPLEVKESAESSEGKYIVAPNGSGPDYDPVTAVTAAYEVEITEAGEYILWGRVSAPSGGDDSFYIQVDNQANQVWNVKRGSAWHWDRVKSSDSGGALKFDLAPGKHMIKVKRREDGAALDKLFLTNNLAVIPAGTGESAENIPPAEPVVYVTDVQYNATGQITRVELGNGTVTTYTYDPHNLRLDRILTVDALQAVIQDLNYTYDGVGNIVEIIDNVNTPSQAFEYDAMNRLKRAENPATYGVKNYHYDEIGNITEKDGKTYFYGEGDAGPHAVTSLSDGTIFAYDANGNMEARQSAGELVQYEYDVENRLTAVEKDGAVIAEYEYDGDGGRTRKVVSGQGSEVSAFVGSLYEVSSGGRNANKEHVFLGGTRIATMTNGEVHYYHHDHLGGTNVLTDSDGAVKQVLEYEPFGQDIKVANDLTPEQQAQNTFTSHYSDEETGLIFMQARYYDPGLGRFITKK